MDTPTHTHPQIAKHDRALMVDNSVFPDLQDLTVEACRQLREANLAMVADLQVLEADDPSIGVQIALLKRENALLVALEKALANREATSGQAQDDNSAKFGH